MATDVARKEEDNVTGLYIFVNLQEHNELDERLTKQVFVRLANSIKISIFARVLVSISPAESHEERSNSITYWKTDDPHPGCGNKHVNYFHDISSGLGNKGRIEHGVDLYIQIADLTTNQPLYCVSAQSSSPADMKSSLVSRPNSLLLRMWM